MSGVDEVNPACKKECYDGEWTLRIKGRPAILVGWLSSDKRSKISNFRHDTILKQNRIERLNEVNHIACIRCHETHRMGDVVFERVMARVRRDVANNRYYVYKGARETWIDMELSK